MTPLYWTLYNISIYLFKIKSPYFNKTLNINKVIYIKNTISQKSISSNNLVLTPTYGPWKKNSSNFPSTYNYFTNHYIVFILKISYFIFIIIYSPTTLVWLFTWPSQWDHHFPIISNTQVTYKVDYISSIDSKLYF